MMNSTSQTTWPRFAGLIVAVAAAASIAACDRSGDSRTAGQKVDDTIAKVEQQTEAIKADVREAARDAKQAGAEVAQGASNTVSEAKQATVDVAEAAADKVKDAIITSKVKSRLGSEPSLSGLVVTVDTRNGRVALRGSAPDSAAAGRAASIASGVDGVSSIDNQLAIVAKP